MLLTQSLLCYSALLQPGSEILITRLLRFTQRSPVAFVRKWKGRGREPWSPHMGTLLCSTLWPGCVSMYVEDLFMRMWVSVHMCVAVWRPEINTGCFNCSLYFETKFLPNLTGLADQTQGPSCFLTRIPQGWDYRDVRCDVTSRFL